jgi:hypothetical protein
VLTLESGPARLDLLVTPDVGGDNSGDRPAVLGWPGALTVTLDATATWSWGTGTG